MAGRPHRPAANRALRTSSGSLAEAVESGIATTQGKARAPVSLSRIAFGSSAPLLKRGLLSVADRTCTQSDPSRESERESYADRGLSDPALEDARTLRRLKFGTDQEQTVVKMFEKSMADREKRKAAKKAKLETARSEKVDLDPPPQPSHSLLSLNPKVSNTVRLAGIDEGDGEKREKPTVFASHPHEFQVCGHLDR